MVRLAVEGDRATRVTILSAGHPAFEMPTTGVIVEGKIYVIANSQMRLMDTKSPLSEIKILAVPVSRS